MAAVKKSGAVARLTPNAIVMVVDGKELRVASDAAENRMLNMIVATQMRTMFQESLKSYADKEMLPTPKELRDLIESAKALTTFTTEVWGVGDGIDPSKLERKPDEQPVNEEREDDFTDLIQKEETQKPEGDISSGD